MLHYRINKPQNSKSFIKYSNIDAMVKVQGKNEIWNLKILVEKHKLKLIKMSVNYSCIWHLEINMTQHLFKILNSIV